ncbi:snurportin-1 [Eurytemora carolleeae]|uniref:snurportin-1 n=1 Tax=Eurytemora carolleeae TaxID=1294199 RepID=UPI000C77406E|nr:snurportin-1 [Eurytemora carolleeae]|eukprot:XP_023336546.1 snurportin-1-like [Eurytemora affinis]
MTTENKPFQNEGSVSAPSNAHQKPPEFDLNLRPGVQISNRVGRSPPGLQQVHNNPPGSRTSLEDLADSFAAGFTVTNTPNDTNRPHPRFAQFKMKTSTIPQDERRRLLLEYQKSRRDDLLNHARCLALGEFEEEEEEEGEEEEMDTTTEIKPRRLYKSYKNQLMLSEWLVEVPDDLASSWILILCPEGRRNFVIASNGLTKVYSKSGKMVKKFPSNLPGGNRNQMRRNSYSILDCIYSDKSKMFYILDMMCWDGFQYYDCDTEFRLSWVQQKFIENRDLMMDSSRTHPYRFMPLPIYQCTQDSISSALNSSLPFEDKLDGLLIYHKNVHYMPGKTPLVGWLKAYMVPELLSIPICNELMVQRPPDYAGMKVFLKKTYDKVERLKKNDEEAASRDTEQEMGEMA